MSSGANTGRGVHATLGAITLGGLLVCAVPSAAAPYPDAGDVVSAFLTVRAWVDEFDLPSPSDPGAAVALGDASGVCVILRRSGHVVGTGVDTTGDALMLRRAAGRAMGEVLGNPAVAALPPEAVARAGLGLSLELEVAGKLVPLLGRQFADVAGQLSPGLDGVAIRRGRNLAMLFPARMRANNTAGRVERMLPALAVEVGLDVMPLPELVRRFDISLYRFRTTDLAQAAAGDPPFVTVRGDRLVLDEQVTRDAINTLAMGIVEHLATAMAPDTIDEPVGLLGTYRPAVDRYEPLIAPPMEQALAAWALSRYARVGGLDAETAARVDDLGRRILDDLGEVGGGEIDPLTSSVACAAIVHAALEHRSYLDAEEPPRLFLEAAERTRSAWTAQDGFIDVDKGTVVPPHGRAMIASAMTRLLAADRTSIDAATVRQAIDAAWGSVPPHRHVSLMPWIGWAEADYAAATGEPVNAAPLRAVRDLLDAGRLGHATGPDEADLAGGFALSSRQPGRATSQTLRPAALFAWMARNPALTAPDEAAAAVGRLLATMRFIMQLAVRDSLVWACPDRRRSLGGIRTATWDWDQPLPAQAQALVTAAETLRSLDAVTGVSE